MVSSRPSKILCLKISGSEDALRSLLDSNPIVAETTSIEGDTVVIETFVSEATYERIRNHTDVKFELLFNATERGEARQKEVGRGNRFEKDRGIPTGLGIKTREEPK